MSHSEALSTKLSCQLFINWIDGWRTSPSACGRLVGLERPAKSEWFTQTSQLLESFAHNKRWLYVSSYVLITVTFICKEVKDFRFIYLGSPEGFRLANSLILAPNPTCPGCADLIKRGLVRSLGCSKWRDSCPMQFQGIFKLFAFIPLVCRKPVGFCPVLLKRESGKDKFLRTNHFLRSFLQSPESVRTNTSIDEESAEVQCKAPNTVELCWTYAATSCTQSIHACQWEVKWYICFIALASAFPDPPQPIASDILMWLFPFLHNPTTLLEHPRATTSQEFTCKRQWRQRFPLVQSNWMHLLAIFEIWGMAVWPPCSVTFQESFHEEAKGATQMWKKGACFLYRPSTTFCWPYLEAYKTYQKLMMIWWRNWPLSPYQAPGSTMGIQPTW